MKVHFRHIWVCAFTLSLIVATPAMAQDKVAVLGFSGPSAGAVRSAVRRVLSEQYEIVDMGQWETTATKVGARGRSAAAIAKVAAELNVKAIVTGGMSRARRMWQLAIVVRNGEDGQVLGRQGRALRAPSKAPAIAGALARNIMPIIDEATGGTGAAPPSEGEPDVPVEDDEGVEDDVEPVEEEDYSAIDSERPPALQVEDDSQAVDEEFPAESEGRRSRRDDDDEGRSRRSRGGFRGWLNRTSPYGFAEIGLDFSLHYRHFYVPINPYCDTSGRLGADFRSSVYPEMGFGLSFFPGGLFTANWAANLGLELDFSHSLYLKIINDFTGLTVEAAQYQLRGGVIFRIPLGNADRGATIAPRIGFGRYSFFLGNVGNDIVPPFVYDHVYLGLNFYIPLATRYIGLEFGGQFLAVLNVGEEAVRAYNASGQLPSAYGYEAAGGLSGQIWRGLRYRVVFELMEFFSNHIGKGYGYGIDPSTICEADTPCREFPTSCVDTSTAEQTPVRGGIFTTDTAIDLIWRINVELSYRFGWDPDRQGRRRGRDAEPEEEDEESGEDDGAEADNWDDGEW